MASENLDLETRLVSNENGALFGNITKESAPFALENKGFPGCHFAFAEFILFQLEKLRYWKVALALSNPFVFH